MNALRWVVTSNKPFGRWGEDFGDDIVAAAMIDRLVHHVDVVALRGDSYRPKVRDLGRVPAASPEELEPRLKFPLRGNGSGSGPLPMAHDGSRVAPERFVRC